LICKLNKEKKKKNEYSGLDEGLDVFWEYWHLLGWDLLG